MCLALLLVSQPPATTWQPFLRVLTGARPPRPRGSHRTWAGLGVQEDTGVHRRVRAHAPGAEVYLHLCRGVCVVRVTLAVSPTPKERFPKVKASAGPSSPTHSGLGKGALGGSSISTPAGDRGARGAALPTYLEMRMLVRFPTPSHPHSS